MSRIRILGASVVLLAAGTGAAFSADVPSYTPPEQQVYNSAPAYSWQGAYVGLLGGYNWGRADIAPPPTPAKPRGFVGGLYAGYNFQPAGRLVLGVETDIKKNWEKGTTSGGLTISSPWDGSLRARAGLAFDRFLIYGTGGVAYGTVKGSSAAGTDSQLRIGWTAGAGIETAITDKVTARLEYRHTDFQTANLPTNGSTADLRSDGVLFGIGVKF